MFTRAFRPSPFATFSHRHRVRASCQKKKAYSFSPATQLLSVSGVRFLMVLIHTYAYAACLQSSFGGLRTRNLCRVAFGSVASVMLGSWCFGERVARNKVSILRSIICCSPLTKGREGEDRTRRNRSDKTLLHLEQKSLWSLQRLHRSLRRLPAVSYKNGLQWDIEDLHRHLLDVVGPGTQDDLRHAAMHNIWNTQTVAGQNTWGDIYIYEHVLLIFIYIYRIIHTHIWSYVCNCFLVLDWVLSYFFTPIFEVVTVIVTNNSAQVAWAFKATPMNFNILDIHAWKSTQTPLKKWIVYHSYHKKKPAVAINDTRLESHVGALFRHKAFQGPLEGRGSTIGFSVLGFATQKFRWAKSPRVGLSIVYMFTDVYSYSTLQHHHSNFALCITATVKMISRMGLSPSECCATNSTVSVSGVLPEETTLLPLSKDVAITCKLWKKISKQLPAHKT